jgi:predicted RND superfamily exporter protein
MGRLNRLLHDDDPAFERPGDSRQANAELIELLAFDDPAMLASWLTLDRSTLRISAKTPWVSHRSARRALESIRNYIRSEFPSNWSVALSGAFAINFDWVNDVQSTQLRSFPTAFLLVFAMVAIFLRSIRLAIGAMIPTLLPVVVTLGAMGWMGMGLDVGRAMIAAVLIGIAVDDSVHLLSQYQRRRVGGDDPGEAIRGAILHTGRAVVTTSLALSLGFLTLMASAWQTISSFGFFVSLAILGALAAALFVLPALIFAFGRGE